MRLLIDSMILAMVLVILIGAVAYRHAADRHDIELLAVRDGLNQFQEKLDLHNALWMAQEDAVGDYPPQIMPDWFDRQLPMNTLVTGKRPWMDIAPAGDYNDHPPDPLATEGQAAFWYNPELGVVRARVPRQDTDRLTLELYNQVNGTSLDSLASDPDPERAPIAFNPNPITSGQHASPYRRTIELIETLEPPVVETPQADETKEEAKAETPWWDKSKTKAKAKSESEAQQESEKEPAPARPTLLSPDRR